MAADRLARAPAPDRRRRGPGQLRRARRGPSPPLRSRTLRLLAELAREHPRSGPDAPRDRVRPPGIRRKPDAPWDITIPAYGRFVRDFCERLGIDRCSLVGNSMGGFIATEVAITDPERVDDLTLVSAAGITWARAWREPAEMLGRVGMAAAPLLLRFELSAIRRPKFRHRAFGGVFHDPNALRRELLWENVVPAFQSPGYFDAMRNLVGYDIRDRLEEIGVPTLIVWGRNDRVVPVPAALSYRNRIGENAELVIFDECGHVPQMERPVRFNRVLSEFLSRAGQLA